jgi:hypothetical protein
MKYRKNHNMDPVVDASPEEVHALRPSIFAYLRRHGCPVEWLEDCAQDVEIVVWQGVAEGRIKGDRVTTPQNALLRFVFMTSWYVWNNHSRRRAGWYEILSDEPPEMASRCPVARLEARETLWRILAEPHTVSVLLGAVDTGPTTTPRSTTHERLTRARRWARDVDAGQWREPRQAMPFTWKQRKKGR